ncbi:MAG: ribonuclease R [Tenericutes bacterium]|jgi:ribonuclease R|nr:ribonuclease R [Mycoplasmatota bacterium]
MKKKVYQLIKKLNYKKRNVNGLAKVLNMQSGSDFQELTKILNELEKDLLVYRDNNGYYHDIDNNKFEVGELDLKYQGYGFLVLENKPDIFIPQGKTHTAMNGDLCLVEITRRKSSLKIEGKIVKILKREMKVIIGEYEDGEIHPKGYSEDIVFELNQKDRNKVKDHQIIKGEIVDYSHHIVKRVKLLEVLGHVDDDGIEIIEITHKFGLTNEFKPEEIKYAKSLPQVVLDEELKGRRDLRKETIFTIDSESTKDIDDAISIKKTDKGHFILGVHIADVSHYVKEDSVLDKSAYDRGTSVYLADSVVPMLPRELSNGICSLNPNVDRLSMTCEMEINKKGEVVLYDIYPSVIHSDHKMTYTNINKIIAGDEDVIKEYKDIYQNVLIMKELQDILNDVRTKMGSINFETIEPKFIFNKSGKITDMIVHERGIGEQMIEEFMLVANQVVATHIYNLKLPFIYRVHELPNEEKIEHIFTMVKELGVEVELEDNITQQNLQKLLKSVEDTKYEKVINTLLLRSMSKARYAKESLGHYGLAFDHYTHFTSPIRRYPDLIVHRFLRRYLFDNNKNITENLIDKFEYIAKQSSKQERQAMQAEREIMDIKKAEYMEQFINKEFTGVISSVLKFGMFVELPNTVEGLVHVSTFKEEMQYDEKSMKLVGVSSDKSYNIGKEVNVKLVKVNKVLGKIDFELV